MAAQDEYEIKIRITADTAQVAQIQSAFNAIGAQVETIKAKAGGAPAAGAADLTQSANLIGRLAGQFVGLAAVYGFIDNIKQAAANIEKVTESLDKQGAQLVENAQHYHELAQGAKTEADVLKIADAALKDINTGHKQTDEILKRELAWYEKILDVLSKQFGAIPGMGNTPIAETLKEQQKQAADLQKQRDTDARAAIKETEEYKEKFEDLETLPFETAFAKVSTEVVDLTNQQEGLNKNAEDYVQRWDEIGHKIAIAKGILGDLVNLQEKNKREAQETAAEREKDVEFTQKQIQRAPPQVQRTLMQEQAAAVARAEGRDRDADMFLRSAEAFKRGMTPQQQQQLKGLEGNRDVVEAINRLADLWK